MRAESYSLLTPCLGPFPFLHADHAAILKVHPEYVKSADCAARVYKYLDTHIRA